MKKRILAIFLTVCLLAALTGCSGGGETVPESSSNASAGGTVDESKYPGLTEQEKEAVELGLLNLDGTMPIIPDPDAFEEKYGKISMFVHYTGGRTRPVTELEIVKMWEELTGIRFEWEDVPYDGVAEKLTLRFQQPVTIFRIVSTILWTDSPVSLQRSMPIRRYLFRRRIL